jgi:transposase
MGHLEGHSRDQVTLFPAAIDDYVDANHPVRVIDAFVDGQDLAVLGFSKTEAARTGRPAYLPAALTKLYVYGYMNQVRSSRRLAKEAVRNVEVMWLTGSVRPSFKTIADFRKDHSEALCKLCRSFVEFCRQHGLIGGDVLAVDGTKLWAVASRKQVMTPGRIAKMTAAIEKRIAEYLAGLDAADAAETGDEPDAAAVEAALATLKAERDNLQNLAQQMKAAGERQRVISEPEAKLMHTARHGYQVAYNGQTAVDAANKLIVAFDLVNDGNDFDQLHAMAAAGREAAGVEAVTVVADAGYSNGALGEACEKDGIRAVVPRPETVNPEGGQYFSRERFTYDRETDSWTCPAGAALTRRKTSQTEARAEYWNTTACCGCRLRPQCTKTSRRSIIRSFYEDAREAMHRRATGDPNWMKLRRETVEHPFAGIKWLMGYPRFLLRGITKAKSELALSILGYNMKRTINILGVPTLLEALNKAPA